MALERGGDPQVEENERDLPVYPIGVVQKLTGLTGRQIRYYEQAELIQPRRTPGNQRLFSPDDVDRLLEIKALLATGLNLDGVRTHLARPQSDTSAPGSEPPGGTSVAQSPIPAIDHAYLLSQMRAGVRLSSLYPVNNQAALAQLLAERRRAQAGHRSREKE